MNARPTSEQAKRIATIMHRKLTTAWNAKEIVQFRKLLKAGCFESAEDLANLERYYARNWPPDRNKNMLRHDLPTLLNNFQGETDRANAWSERHPAKPVPRKIIPLPPIKSEPFVASTDPADVAQLQRFNEEYAARKARPL